MDNIKDLPPRETVYNVKVENTQVKLLLLNCLLLSVLVVCSIRFAAKDAKIPDEVIRYKYKYINMEDCPKDDPFCFFVDEAKFCGENDFLCLAKAGNISTKRVQEGCPESDPLCLFVN